MSYRKMNLSNVELGNPIPAPITNINLSNVGWTW